MPVKKYRPYTPSRRHMSTPSFAEITKSEPEKTLLEPMRKRGGRNNQGRMTMWTKGGGHKRRYRRIDFKRHDKIGIPAKVCGIEYDPNRSAFIALLVYADGEKRYILAPEGLTDGANVLADPKAEVKPGNAKALKDLPTGALVHNIEMSIGKGGVLCRSAGAFAQIMAQDQGYTLLRMPSGEVRNINSECWATVGQVGNLEHANLKIGKAGRSRWLGRRPVVRATAMNPIDHPMGGGEGRGKGNHPMTPWGQPSKGFRTRSKKKASNKMIVRRRYAK